MRAPEFWARDGILPALLSPLAGLYAMAGDWRRAATRPYRAAVPVICAGGVTAGGAGKTPVALALARRLVGRGRRVHLLSRGHGGSATGPLAVDPRRHDAATVGDEPLLLAAAAPCWVARNRAAGARAAVAAGADIIVMDDGLQNPTLFKDLSLLVVDGEQGFGNGRVMPAGPLREPVERALPRADAAVLIGEDRAGVAGRVGATPLLRARLVAEAADLTGRRVLAFAGIARPAKFFAALAALGAEVAAAEAFPDHHRYTGDELSRLFAAAERLGALPVTTEKDAVRLPPAARGRVRVVVARLDWDDAAALDRLLNRVLAEG